MTPVESQQITEIGNELREFRSEFRVVKTKLFGDDETEDAQGRIPRMEATSADHGKRIRRLENLVLRGSGAIVLVLIISAVMQFLYHTVEVFKR